MTKKLYRVTMMMLLCVTLCCQNTCRKKRLTVLHAIPHTSPIVVWLPAPETTIRDVVLLLSRFHGEALAQQLDEWRREFEVQLGIDVLNPASYHKIGINTELPFAIAWSADLSQPVVLFSTKDNDALMQHVKTLAKNIAVADVEETLTQKSGELKVFGQKFGDAMLETLAIRTSQDVAMVAFGEGCKKVLMNWPEPDMLRAKKGKDSNFGNFWKKAESDGSISGAAIRILIQNTFQSSGQTQSSLALMAQAFQPLMQQNSQIRGALHLSSTRVDFFATALHLKENIKKTHLVDSPAQFAIGQGLSPMSFLFARSELKTASLLNILRQINMINHIFQLVEQKTSPDKIEDILTPLNGRGHFFAEFSADSLQSLLNREIPKNNRQKAEFLLNIFALSLVAEINQIDAFDHFLQKMAQYLKKAGFEPVLEKTKDNGVTLTTPTLVSSSQATLSGQQRTMLYAIGPGAYSRLKSKMAQKQHIQAEHAIFSPLLMPDTSGIIVDFSQLFKYLPQFLNITLGQENTLVQSYLQRLAVSLEHIKVGGVVLSFEGQAWDPHPMMRMWIELK